MTHPLHNLMLTVKHEYEKWIICLTDALRASNKKEKCLINTCSGGIPWTAVGHLWDKSYLCCYSPGPGNPSKIVPLSTVCVLAPPIHQWNVTLKIFFEKDCIKFHQLTLHIKYNYIGCNLTLLVWNKFLSYKSGKEKIPNIWKISIFMVELHGLLKIWRHENLPNLYMNFFQGEYC